jgi:hypothetical protein
MNVGVCLGVLLVTGVSGGRLTLLQRTASAEQPVPDHSIRQKDVDFRGTTSGVTDDSSFHAHFTISGVFVPTNVDTNGDGFGAATVTEQIVGGELNRTTGHGKLRRNRLVRQNSMVEYALTDPFHNCFRVDEDDFSVEENVYTGPLFELVDPIRVEPVASDPLLVPYRAENWTVFYQLETGELLFGKIAEFQICVENVPEDVAPWPLCHVRSRTTIVGGTGRFKHATGEVVLTAIAPTATGNAPAFDHNGNLNMVFPPEGAFLFGPVYGVSDMHVELPLTDGDEDEDDNDGE